MEVLQLRQTQSAEPAPNPQIKTIRPEQGGSSHVRFTASEYRHIQNDSNVTNTSIPLLLKRAYFIGAPLVPLMRKDDLTMMVNQLARIGNNVNQIARQLNSGFREGFNDDLTEVRKSLTLLVKFITSTYGSSKTQRTRDEDGVR
jgi:hypothetical protein